MSDKIEASEAFCGTLGVGVSTPAPTMCSMMAATAHQLRATCELHPVAAAARLHFEISLVDDSDREHGDPALGDGEEHVPASRTLANFMWTDSRRFAGST